MERWDFDCQKCRKNIGDAWYVNPEWYQCAQDRGKWELLKKAFSEHIQKTCPAINFDSKGNLTGGTFPRDEKALKEIKEGIAEGLKEKLGRLEVHGGIFIDIDFEKRLIRWSSKDESEFSEENYQRAGLVKHLVQGRGQGRLGYCFCAKCVEELNYNKCPVCGSELVKVIADQHPGGHWGIRGRREPAPMR